MNYKERISALRTFKSSISSGETDDKLSSIDYSVTDWTDDSSSKMKFDSYILNVKSTSSVLAQSKSDFLSDVDALINVIQGAFDQEYAQNKAVVTKTYSNDSKKNKQKKRLALAALNIDSSVKDALRKLI